VIAVLVLSFGFFYALDLDGPGFLPVSTAESTALEATQDEIKHGSSPDQLLRMVLAVCPCMGPRVNAVSPGGPHPAVTSPVVPLRDRVCPRTFPRSTLPDPPPVA